MSEVLPVDRRMRGTLALGIVGGGIALASVFGRADRPPGLETPFPSGPVPLRRRLEVLTPPLSSQDPGAVASEQIPLASVARSVTVEKHPAIAEAPTPDILPPTLAKSFPAIPVPTRPASDAVVAPPVATPPPAENAGRTHRIVNGDTLPDLAARYLGDSGRAEEIFDANRDRLSNPEALPIGLDLRIPSPNAPNRKVGDSAAQDALVPIVPRPTRHRGNVAERRAGSP